MDVGGCHLHQTAILGHKNLLGGVLDQGGAVQSDQLQPQLLHFEKPLLVTASVAHRNSRSL